MSDADRASRRARWGWVIPCAAVGAAALAGVAVAWWVGSRRGADVFEEGGVIEWAQAACWLVSVGAAVVALATHRGWRDRLNAAWLVLLSGLATVREFDLHDRLNPRDGHQSAGADAPLNPYGVSFKLKWWLDGDVDPLLKAVWGAALLVVAALVVVPPVVVRAPVVRLLRGGDAASWLFVGAIGLLGLGYVMDDLVGQLRVLPLEWTRSAEETVELLGAMAFLGSLVLTVRRPLSRRV